MSAKGKAAKGKTQNEAVITECRACLTKVEGTQNVCSVFQPWSPAWDGMEPTIAEDLAKVAHVVILKTDLHSKVICSNCYQKLYNACTFAASVRTCDLMLKQRYPECGNIDKVWPKPIQVDKQIGDVVLENAMQVEIKQETMSDDEDEANPTESYAEADLEIKIEPEEFVQPAPMQFAINGTSLHPSHSNATITNGTEEYGEEQDKDFEEKTSIKRIKIETDPTLYNSSMNVTVGEQSKTRIKTTNTINYKAIVENLAKQDMSSRAIHKLLLQKYSHAPSLRQIKKYVDKRETLSDCTRNSLIDWIVKNSDIPDDMNEVFVLYFSILDDKTLQFLVSSKKLLQNAFKIPDDLVLYINLGKTLNWQGFHVSFLGTTDRNRKFHLIAISLCPNITSSNLELMFSNLRSKIFNIFKVVLQPKVLVVDIASNALDGFCKVFNDCPMRVCWNYMRKHIQNKAEKVLDLTKLSEFLSDIDFVQLSCNKAAYIKSCELFLEKWKEEEALFEFLKTRGFFLKPGWYAGFCHRTTSTMNEDLVRSLQDYDNEFHFKQNCTLPSFITFLKKAILTASETASDFAETVTYGDELWTKAVEWVKLDKNIHLTSNDELHEIFMIASQDNGLDIDPDKINIKDEHSFDKYVKLQSLFYNLYFPKDPSQWQKGRCTCVEYYNNHACKHFLGAALKLNYTHRYQGTHVTKINERKRRTTARALKAAVIPF